MRHSIDFSARPLIVFWEATRACMLKCIHCRAEAILKPLPGELSTEEARNLIDQVASFGHPPPILVFTGGDPLARSDIWELVEYAKSRGLKVAMAPAVTPMLDYNTIKRMVDVGVDAVSISVDAGVPEVHDAIRGVQGSWRRSIKVLKMMRDYGLRVQINTVVMRTNLPTLPKLVKVMNDIGVYTWEVFYLIVVGRAGEKLDLSPAEWEDVSLFLYEVSRYGFTVRTVEGPMFRRIVLTMRLLEKYGIEPQRVITYGNLYSQLVEELRQLMGPPRGESRAQTTGTRDGHGIIFVAYNGDVYPSGFTPYPLGNVKKQHLKQIYREHPILKAIHAAKFHGRCGRCEFRKICGGSRARAYAVFRDVLGEDPACMYQPSSMSSKLREEGVEIDMESLVNKAIHMGR